MPYPCHAHLPAAESCLRLVRALPVEMHENWLEATRYLNTDQLKEHKKQPFGRWPPEGGRAPTAPRYTGLRTLRSASPTPAKIAELVAHN